MKRFLMIILPALSLAFAGCTQTLTLDTENMLKIASDAVTIQPEGGLQEVDVLCEHEWHTKCESDWLWAYNNGEGKLVVGCEHNETGQSRTVTVTACLSADESIFKTMTVTQEAVEPRLSFSESSLTCGAGGGVLEATVNSNVSWVAGTNADWVTVSEKEGYAGETVLHISVQQNNSTDGPRTAKVTVRNAANDISQSIEIVQEALVPELSVSEAVIDAPMTPSSYSVDVTSNVGWSVVCDVEWVTFSTTAGQGDWTLQIDVDRNHENSARSAVVKIVNAAYGLEKTISVTQAAGEYVAFKDENFKKYCIQNYDADKDGFLTFAEAGAVQQMIVESLQIKSLSGIEHFTNLISLECQYNELTSLDVSKNTKLERLCCYDNSLTSLDVSKNTELDMLWVSNNELTSLDVSKNTKLFTLYCYFNSLTSIDLSHNTELRLLLLHNNDLTSLDVSNNLMLSWLDCRYNYNLQYIYLKEGQTIVDMQIPGTSQIVYR